MVVPNSDQIFYFRKGRGRRDETTVSLIELLFASALVEILLLYMTPISAAGSASTKAAPTAGLRFPCCAEVDTAVVTLEIEIFNEIQGEPPSASPVSSRRLDGSPISGGAGSVRPCGNKRARRRCVEAMAERFPHSGWKVCVWPGACTRPPVSLFGIFETAP